MKKIIAILLVVLLAFAFVSCKGECELCGQTASLKKLTYEGESGKYCKDCYDFAKSMTDFANALGF